LYTIDYAVPQGALSQFVSMFYRFETDGADNGDLERADIAHCRIQFGGTSYLRFGDNEAKAYPPEALIGVRNRASYVYSEGAGWMFGFGLLPAGWCALTGASAAKAADKLFPAAEFLGEIASEVRSAIENLNNLSEMVSAAQAVLEPYCVRSENVPHWFVRAVDEWLASSLQPEFDDLVSATGLSHSKAETMLREIYGAPPKLFIRKCRALRVANRIAHGEGDWQDYVGDAFYDQSHCIKEIKHFTGVTPAMIRDARTSMTHTQFKRRRELAADQA
jgi:AraC-like DNA-binding protein